MSWCTKCLKRNKHRKAKPGRKWCHNCLTVQARSARRYKAKLDAEGRCSQCTKPKGPNDTGVVCNRCQAKQRDIHRKLKAERQAKGLCYACGKNPVSGNRSCEDCLSKRRWKKR